MLWGPDIVPTVSVRLSRPCSLWVHVHVIDTLNSTIYAMLFLFLSFSHHLPHPHIHWLNTNEFHEKISKTG